MTVRFQLPVSRTKGLLSATDTTSADAFSARRSDPLRLYGKIRAETGRTAEGLRALVSKRGDFGELEVVPSAATCVLSHLLARRLRHCDAPRSFALAFVFAHPWRHCYPSRCLSISSLSARRCGFRRSRPARPHRHRTRPTPITAQTRNTPRDHLVFPNWQVNLRGGGIRQSSSGTNKQGWRRSEKLATMTQDQNQPSARLLLTDYCRHQQNNTPPAAGA
ncbi:hypothetical protein EXIGLDRAFT_371308 [Exidia glandulosa HHB12029]|uniref:Uncharacterized protein n=1 Tax=Exidia glandulosa HHB12029 TaxID=1314781 RepID=A0A165C0L4_EXIGL|nr:hypothetical protein EXIGLDRAFT_371308 [Exidia glandulosa HHB12029]